MNTSDQNSAGPKVFISYRRRSDAPYARLLRQDLGKEFGAEAVFRDVERIEGGEKFLPQIYAALGNCNTFLILISPEWLEAATRLHEPEDFVRAEIAAALASGVRIIPLLLNGAQMPPKRDLPDDIKELTSYQAEELRDTRWEDDVRNLIAAIRAPFAATTTRPTPPPSFFEKLTGGWWGKALLVALLLTAGFALWQLAPDGGTHDNGNQMTPTPTPLLTPSPTPTVVPTQTPAQTPTPTTTQTPAPVTKCFREFLPKDRWTGIRYGSPYERTVIRQDQAKDGSAGILLMTRDGREIGAIRFRFLEYGKDERGSDWGYYEVEQVVGTDCVPIPSLSQQAGEGGQTARRNYEWVEKIPLEGRTYDLRLAYSNNAIIAYFSPKQN